MEYIKEICADFSGEGLFDYITAELSRGFHPGHCHGAGLLPELDHERRLFG